ncbi:MAG: ISNCY family transposase [Gracilibacteraceae bacterium]|jgi:transposase|nr:ISNCY family transposase [Gracilibacteraceae bacterium]
MEKDIIIMSTKQLTRYDIITKAIAGYITVGEAAIALGLSNRQVKRLKKEVAIRGVAAVLHGNAGRAPASKITEPRREEIIGIFKGPAYKGCNFKHFQELLSERHSIEISYSTLYKLLRGEGAASPKTRRRFKPHRRRKRRPQAGLLIQTDATSFAWFQGDRRRYALHGGIDDATGQITGLYMCKNECTPGYYEVVRRTIDNFGVPAAIYADRHTIFQSPNTKKHEIDASVPVNDTQFGRALKELGINLIAARSPQAKGRVERLWDTLQSRLPVEFALNGITTMEEANEFLERYVYAFNSMFAVEPENAESVFRKLRDSEDLDTILCIKEKRVIDAGGVFSYSGKSYQIAYSADSPPLPAKSKIDVLFGPTIGIKAAYKGKVFDVLPFIPSKRRKQAPAPAPAKERGVVTPPPDHAWKGGIKGQRALPWKYDGEDEDVHREVVRGLERALLGARR